MFIGRNKKKYIYSTFSEAKIRKLIINIEKEETEKQQQPQQNIRVLFSCFLFFSEICAAENHL